MDLQGLDDSALLRRARRDPEAFAALYRRRANAAYRSLLAACSHEQVALDLTAETFASALVTLGGFRVDAMAARPRLAALVERLPSEQRAVLRLRVVDGVSYAERLRAVRG